MFCRKCKKEIPEGSAFCCWCGVKQTTDVAHRVRPNGTGYAYRRGRTWTARVTLGFELRDDVLHRVVRTKGGFKTKTEALAYCETLKNPLKKESSMTLLQLYEKWLPTHEQRVGASTIAGYKAAFQHFKSLHYCRFQSIKTDDWQQCIDDCPRGKRVKEDMRTVAGLLCKYAYNLDLIDKNYAANLYTGNDRKGTRPPFSHEEIEQIHAAIGVEKWADYVYFMIYTGFRPTEMFKLRRDSYHPQENILIGGGKTKAGTDRTITLSPKVIPILHARLEANSFYLFPREDGRQMTETYFRNACFNPLMARLGIKDKYPYSCRHTFANLLKNVTGSDTDKAALMGHADASMTKYYQAEDIDSLRRITDAI